MSAAISSAVPAEIALRQYEAEQDRLDLAAGTDSERERFIDDWLDAHQKKLGTEYVTEALAEMGDVEIIELFARFKEGALETGCAVQVIVRNYWLPLAIAACDEHDFTPEPPCRCRDGESCTC
jgi:hypothetical protein